MKLHSFRARAAMAVLLGAAVLLPTACAPKNTVPTYTLHEYLITRPDSWNPLTRSAPEEKYPAAYTEIGLIDAAYDPKTGAAEWVYEMASDIEDVTADSADALTAFGLAGDTGLMWKITLNPDACWADGTPINADTYVESMKLLLDPQQSYVQAERFCTGDAALAHAADYCENDRTGETVYGDIVVGTDESGAAVYASAYTGEADAYVNPDEPCVLLGGKTLADEIASYQKTYACFATLADYCGTGTYTAVTADLRAALVQIAQLYGHTEEDAWLKLCVCPIGVRAELPWTQVGLYAGTDEYTLYYVCAAPTTEAQLFTQLSNNWLVKSDLFAQSQQNGISAYNTSAATSCAYGPYRLVSADEKQLVFTRNTSWYGYADDLHANQYQTTDIVCRFLSDSTEIMDAFNQGKLDVMALNSEDTLTLSNYRNSVNILRAESTSTQRLIFVTDRAALTAISDADASGGSRLLLAYPDFRKAISLAIDRADYVRNGTVCDRPALGLFSNLYYADSTDPSAVYRQTAPAIRALCEAYGAEEISADACAALTGYNPTYAAELFTAAYEAAVAAGDVAETGRIRLRCAVEGTELTPVQERQAQLLQKYLDEATAGTPLENRLWLTFVPSDDRYGAVASGEIELAIGAWGGAVDNPYSLIRCYTDPSFAQVNEQCGFNPLTETCTISLNGEEQTHTFYEWGASLNAGGLYAQVDSAVRLEILAGLERALLEAGRFAVLSTDCSVSLFSDQIRFATEEYNLLCGYGGVRGITYHYNDADWANYVKQAGDILDYTAQN